MAHDPSLFSDVHQGGIIGGRGFTAQAVTLLYRLPTLFDDAEFEGVMYEGQEDIDLRFTRPEGRRFHLVQCKAKTVSNPDVREILNGMYQRYQQQPMQYEAFELVAWSFPSKVEAVRQGAHTANRAREGYSGTITEQSTASDFATKVKAMLDELNCTSTITADWIIKYVKFSTDIPSYPFDDRTIIDRFASRCTDCRQFGVQILAPFRYAAATLHQTLELRLGGFLTRQELAQIVHDACEAYKEQVQEKGVKIHVDHWRDKDGRAISEADHVFEWREHYAVAGRGSVPSAEVTERLLQELQTFGTNTMNIWKDANVQLLPPCSLSAAFVVGHTFRQTRGYRLSTPSATGQEIWSFDRDMTLAGDIQLRVTGEGPGREPSSAVVALGVGRDITAAVRNHVDSHGLPGKFVAYQTSINQINEHQARKVADEFIGILRDLDSAGVTDVHLFYAGPMPLAAMIGSLMNKIGRVFVYELDDQRKYHLAFTLNT
ncbi:SAVED domain-containing protein [Deinococcus taklimakanensis]|uniref:SAVED domain-containing protein n=1 Tax=Deinococcus taklimakanensis TaxID=536443 RepID=A0ABW5P3W5_9DEIO